MSKKGFTVPVWQKKHAPVCDCGNVMSPCMVTVDDEGRKPERLPMWLCLEPSHVCTASLYVRAIPDDELEEQWRTPAYKRKRAL
jgi:hypothetical protein